MEETPIMDTNQYLSFILDKDIFAIEISRVREVLEYSRVTKVPKSPDFLCGVINLRGRVVPVVDMRLKFGMTKTEQTVDTCIIIVEIHIDEELTVLGAMVDSVREVIELESQEIEPPPRIGTHLDTSFIKGMGKKNDEFIIILDINKVFSLSELTIVNNSQSRVPEISGEIGTLSEMQEKTL